MSEVAAAPASIGVLGTTMAHAIFVAALVLAAHRRTEPATVSYAVELVAAPAASNATARTATVAPPKREPDNVVAAKPTLKPKKPEPKKATPQRPATEAKLAAKDAPPKATTTPLPGEVPSTGQDVLTKSFPGLDFPDKYYLANIVNQIYSRFPQQGWPPTLEATIGFTIHRDGSVTDIVVMKQSSNYSFTVSAKGAVEAAAKANAFGTIPSIWPGDQLPIAFSFSPRKP